GSGGIRTTVNACPTTPTGPSARCWRRAESYAPWRKHPSRKPREPRRGDGMFEKVLVTGGAGYVGCVLVPKLLAAGHRVTVSDRMLLGDQGLPRHRHLNVVTGDLRDTGRLRTYLAGVDALIHLACISNDPSFELDPGLSKAINYDCFEPLVEASA